VDTRCSKTPRCLKNYIAEYVDEYTSCQRNTQENVLSLIEMQTHRHSKTCRKKGKPVCRFGFPLPPMGKTIVLDPLDKESQTLKKKFRRKSMI